MKILNHAMISSVVLSLFVVTGSIMSEAKTSSDKEVEFINLGCTQNLKTILRQQAPDYCQSKEADSGILFDRVNINRNKDRSTQIEFNIFNRGSADGVIEIYNADKSLQDIKIIEGNRPPTGLIQAGKDLFTNVPASLFSRYPLGDDRRDLKEQNFIVNVPAGGSVKITKSSKFAIAYNTVMLALEVSQLGDSEFTKSETTKKFIQEFSKDVAKQAAINIFKGEPNLQSAFNLDFIDKNKLSEVLLKFIKYTATIEQDPAKNPVIGAFSDVYSNGVNYGLENVIDRYISPGLGTLARTVRIGGNTVSTAARAADLRNAIIYGDKSTVTAKDISVDVKNQASKIPITFTPQQPSSPLKKAIVSQVFSGHTPDLEQWNLMKPPFSFAEVDLNNDGKRETIVLYRHRSCSNRSCLVDIFKFDNQKKSYKFISNTSTSRGWLEVALLPTKSYGWQDLAIRYFSYETRTIDWYPVKFNGKEYKTIFELPQRLTQTPENIILSEKSTAFDLGDFPGTQVSKPISAVNSLSPQLTSMLPRLKQNTKVPILLPSNFPSQDIIFCPESQQNKYQITLLTANTLECSISQARYVGYISGEIGHQTLKTSDESFQKIQLSNGILGYYSPRAYKSPPSIAWLYKKTLYNIQITEYADGKNRSLAQSKAFLRDLANSAIQNGAR